MCKGTAFLRNSQLYLYVVQHVFICCATYFPGIAAGSITRTMCRLLQEFAKSAFFLGPCKKCTMFKFPGKFAQSAKIGRSGLKLSGLNKRPLIKKNAPSPGRRKGGLAPLSCPRGNGAHGALHPWDVLFTLAALYQSSASRAKKMPEALTSPGHPNEPYYL